MIIGITGGIASGKSLVTSYLLNNNYQVIDCDQIAHNVLKNKNVKDELKNEFGEQIFINDEVNRKELGKIVFSSKEKNEQLQLIVYPYILNSIIEEINQLEGMIFLDAPLLFEYQLQNIVDKIIVVKVSDEIQIKRLMERDNISKAYALNKINSQLPMKLKEKKADYVINNNYDVETTYYQLKKILELLEGKNEN